MKRFFFAYAWILLSTGVILTSVAVVNFMFLKDHQLLSSDPKSPEISQSGDEAITGTVAGEVKGIKTDYQSHDARANIVTNFLERHNSPLTPYEEYGQFLVDLADEHGFDFRLLPAMAMQESNLCKSIPEDSYNCLGFGIHSRGTLRFDSYRASFQAAAQTLKEKYIDIGLTTPQEIMTKYTPSSDGSWAESVNQWMAEMKYDDRQKGRTHKTNSSVFEYAEEQIPDATSGATLDN